MPPSSAIVLNAGKWGLYLCSVQAGLSGAVNGFQFGNVDGVLKLQVDVAGTITSYGSTTYSPVTHTWFRLRTSGTTIFADTSIDGYTWVNYTSASFSFAITALYAGLTASYDSTQTSVYVAWDQVNIVTGGPSGVAMPSSGAYAGKTQVLAEDFAGSSLNGAVWNGFYQDVNQQFGPWLTSHGLVRKQ